VSVLVGGAPVSASFAEQIGADAYCRDAFEAVDTLERLQREHE
jgi:5-methyltetrahydrofolate--homocysteine methyltransferase